MDTITVDPPEEGLANASPNERDPDDEAPRRPSQVGRVVAGKYELVKLLGEGGMGAVYEAQHLLIGRRVAVKFVHTELAWRSDILSRFSREARAAGSLESENIAAVTDFGTDADGTPFLVMEYLVGVDLAQVLVAHGPLPVPRACHLLVQTCRGLSLAHAKGIVHRDLKPDNLFVVRRPDGTDLLKILDFGIAKLQTPHDAKSATQTGSAIGTPYYMPPEQVRGARSVDHRADVYALGVILYELLSAKKPHTGESYTDVLFHVISAKPIPLDTHRPGLPRELVAIVDKAMAFEPADRFQSADELLRAVAPFAGNAITPVEIAFDATSRLSDPNADTSLPPPDEAVPATTPAVSDSSASPRLGDGVGALSVSTPGGERRASLVDDAEWRGREAIDRSDDASPSRSGRSSKAAQIVVGGLVVGAMVVVGVALSRGSGGSTQAAARPPAVPVAPVSGEVGVVSSTPEKVSERVSEKVSEKVSATVSADTPGHLPAAVVLTPSNEGAPPATSTSAVKGSKPSAAPKSQALAVPGPTTPPKRPVSDLYTP